MAFVVTAPIQEHTQNRLIRTKRASSALLSLKNLQGFYELCPGAREKEQCMYFLSSQ